MDENDDDIKIGDSQHKPLANDDSIWEYLTRNIGNIISLLIIILIYVLQCYWAFIYQNQEYPQGISQIEILTRKIGYILPVVIIPIIIASISRIFFKKNFGNVLLICLIFISIPLTYFGYKGSYYLYKQEGEVKLPEIQTNSEAFNETKSLIILIGTPQYMENQIDLVIKNSVVKLQEHNPQIPENIIQGISQKMKSDFNTVIWQKNNLMDQLIQSYSNSITPEQREKLLNYYKNPLVMKQNSSQSLSDNEKAELKELTKNTFDKSMQECVNTMMEDSKPVVEEWIKHMIKSETPRMNEYLNSLGYKLEGYTLSQIK